MINVCRQRAKFLKYLCAFICVGPKLGLFVSMAAHAQSAAPSQLTPQSLRPEGVSQAQSIILPGPSAPQAVAGNNRLTFIVGEVRLQDLFGELAAASEALVEKMRGRRVTVAEIYSTASALERIYNEAGYPLVRVVVPPQNLVDGGDLRLRVVDGFVDAIDVVGVPERARAVVAERMAGIIGRRHLRLIEIEHAVLLAGDLPGLRLRSALERGHLEGGVRLILEGEHRLASGSVSIDNQLPRSLGSWQKQGALALNQAFGFGEQVYGTLGHAGSLASIADGTSPLTFYGGGVILPIGVDGITINPEYTHSTTHTVQTSSVPATLGTFDRYALSVHAVINQTRRTSLFASFSLQEIDQQIAAPNFGATLNRDRYRVFRGGPDYKTLLPWGAGLQFGAALSMGLGGRSAIEAEASGIPLSRLGASPEFTKLTANVHMSQALPAGFNLNVIAAGQFTRGKPMLRSEQIALDGTDRLSAFASGTFSADQGLAMRGEVSRTLVPQFTGLNSAISAYAFGAIGRGWLANPTAVEQAAFEAQAVGLGIRSTVEVTGNVPSSSVALEVARGFTDLTVAKAGWRANIAALVSY